MSVCTFLLAACSGGVKQLEERMQADLADLRSIQAEHTAEISEIRGELRTISGKVEELQHVAMGRTTELERSLRRLGTRVPPPEGVPEDLLSRDEEKISRITGASAEDYKRALGQLRAGDFEGASSTFSGFAEANPGTAFTDNALFWLGICYSQLGQYDRAIVSFTDVFQSYPAEDMVPAALFYLAEAFHKAGSKQEALDALQMVIDDHPRSKFASKARKRKREIRRGRSRRRR